ncbi:MAG: LacI family DNA-binding transcriptional regulator [Oscillospiraceae bacterium]|nr:LacI family DNA-binding transcriptional regulator [Oscillospiraceae bacterium]
MAKTVRMSDIAKKLNVSTVTVSKALSGKDGVSGSLRTEIQQLAEKMGYQKKSAHAGIAHTFGIITSHRYIEKGHSFYWTLYERVLCHLSQCGNIGILEIVTEQDELALELPHLIQDNRVDGLIVMGNFSDEYQLKLSASNLPLIMLDSYNAEFPHDSVISDGYYGMYEMVHYLIQMGHRKIAFVGSVGETSSIADRYYGYCRAMREAGIDVTDDMVIPDRDNDRKIYLSVDDIVSMPTAFACNCDSTAYVLLNLLKEKGYRVPDDISIVGFDNFVLSELAVPQITTYAVNLDMMAKESVRQLMNRVQYHDAEPCRIVVSGTLIERSSVIKLS